MTAAAPVRTGHITVLGRRRTGSTQWLTRTSMAGVDLARAISSGQFAPLDSGRRGHGHDVPPGLDRRPDHIADGGFGPMGTEQGTRPPAEKSCRSGAVRVDGSPS